MNNKFIFPVILILIAGSCIVFATNRDFRNASIHQVAYFLSTLREYPLVRASAEVRDDVHFDKTVVIGQRTNIKGNVWIGKHVKIQDDVKIWGDVNIGDYTHINPFVFIASGFHDADDKTMLDPTLEPVVIGKCVRIDAGSIIFKGVTIGDKATIKVGSVVMDDVPEYAVVQGNPAKIVGYRENKDDNFCIPIWGKK